MQNNSKKSIVKETRNVRARLLVIKGCAGVDQSRKLKRASINCFNRSTNDALFVDNGISFILCPLCLIFASRQLFPPRHILLSILNNAVSNYFKQGFPKNSMVTGL